MINFYIKIFIKTDEGCEGSREKDPQDDKIEEDRLSIESWHAIPDPARALFGLGSCPWLSLRQS